MWTVESVEFRCIEVDAIGSGQGRHTNIGVWADGVQIVNDLSVFATGAESVQLFVCDCGYVGCKSGDWVALRRVGEGLLAIPCFSMLDRREVEYDPPDFIADRGSMYLTQAVLAALRTREPAFDDLARWPALTAREAVYIIQRSAPAHLLGVYPDQPRLRRELLIAVDPGELEEHIPVMETLLESAFGSDRPVQQTRGELVTFYLDQPGIVEWSPLAYDGSHPALALGPDLIVSGW